MNPRRDATMTRYLDTVEQPWTREILEASLFKSSIDARACIDETVGGMLWRDLEHLSDAVWIFEASAADLLDEICVFGNRSKNPAFWHEANRSEADRYTRSVKQKLFYCTSSLMALVDHARSFQSTSPVTEYATRLTSTFATPGLHDFLQCLRNYNAHWRIAQTHWSIEHDFVQRTREAKFEVPKAELLAWDKWTQAARTFINKANESINVYDVISTYRTQVHNFYSWHRGAVLDQYAPILQPYFEYKRVFEGLQKKYHWNLVISHAPKSLNPYQYISRYLSPAQVEHLLALEHRSVAQVETLIRMLGMEDFCDEDLRKKAFALFSRSAS
jgi:hypothetical protein